jgi:S1-C subfamily serine protease
MRTLSLAVALTIVATIPRLSIAKDLATADLVEKAKPAIVVIHTSDGKGYGAATGFIVAENGVIVTNFHVIRGAGSASIKCANGVVFDEVTVRAVDEERDLAILEVPGSKLPTVSLAGPETPRIGSRAVVIGNPLGVLEWSVSVGVISAVRTEDGLTLIQSDVAANPGNSGGPLLDEAGRVAGVVTAKIVRAEGLTFAVPAKYVRELLVKKGGATKLGRLTEDEWRGATDGGEDNRKPTARCRDGSVSYSKHRSGTCSGHGGVAEWMTQGSE